MLKVFDKHLSLTRTVYDWLHSVHCHCWLLLRL